MSIRNELLISYVFWFRDFWCWRGKKRRDSQAITRLFNEVSEKKINPKM